MDFISVLQFGCQRAFLGGCVIAVLCSVLGLFLVLRKMSLIGDGLSHVSFGAVALGLLANLAPLYAALPLVVLASLAILKLTEKARLYGDAAIGIVSALGIASGVVLASVSGGFNVDLFSYLFGNILAIGDEELVLAVALSAGVLVAVAVFTTTAGGRLDEITHDHPDGADQYAADGADSRHGCARDPRRGLMPISALLILPMSTAPQLAAAAGRLAALWPGGRCGRGGRPLHFDRAGSAGRRHRRRQPRFHGRARWRKAAA
jgi:zinc transport system permease protein